MNTERMTDMRSVCIRPQMEERIYGNTLYIANRPLMIREIKFKGSFAYWKSRAL